MSARAVLAGGGSVLLAVALAGAVAAQGPAGGPVSPSPGGDFVGSSVCRECHAVTHSSWTNGRHSRMLQEARAGTVIPAFDRTVTLHGKPYELRSEGGQYFIVERYLQAEPVRRRVDYTLGSRRVQHFLSRLGDGRIVVLPPSFDVEKKEWFHNLDIVDLEESSTVKVQVWNSNCFGCHVSGEEKGFDPGTRSYATTWTDFGTTCERCHGPGRTHANRYAKTRKPDGSAPAREAGAAGSPDQDSGIVHPRRVTPETSTTLCAQCHSLRDITQPGFAGGSNYYDYFTPLLEYAQKRNHDPAYWPNGRPRRFSNEALAFWESGCFFKGGATCLSCHTDVHEPNIERNEQLNAKQNRLCSGCHQEIADQGSMHTHHAESPGSSGGGAISCVSCHMPRTVISLRHRMPDHTLSVPAPENTRRFGIPNACNECHRDKSPAWAEGRLQEWFPGGRRRRAVADAVAFSGGAEKDAAALDPLLQIAADPTRPPLIRANALGYLRNYAEPRATAALLAGSLEAHPALRLVSQLSLLDRGRDPSVRAAIEAGLLDARRTVRMAAALGLMNTLPGRPVAAELSAALEGALRDHVGRARFLNEDASTQLDLGKMLFLAGRMQNAEASMRDALNLEPRIAGGRYFLGLTLLGQGRVAEGAAELRGVNPKDPHRADAQTVLARLKTP